MYILSTLDVAHYIAIGTIGDRRIPLRVSRLVIQPCRTSAQATGSSSVNMILDDVDTNICLHVCLRRAIKNGNKYDMFYTLKTSR